MGTCLSRCYPETNTSTNGFSGSIKGNERSVKCEYRRIFKGNRNEDSKRWSSTPKRQKYTSAEIPSHLCHSNHMDRSLPRVPSEPLVDSKDEYNFLALSKSGDSPQQGDQKHCLDPNELSNHFNFASDEYQKIDELFETYYEPDQDCILADGVERLCTDLCLPPDDFRVLLLAWHFEAETMCRFTRKEFCRGLRKLKVDSLQSLRSKIFAGCSCKKCTSARLMTKHEESLDKFDDDKDERENDDQLYGHIYPSHEDGPFVTEITSNREAFKSIYRWSYRFALDMETGQRTLPLDMAMSMWQLIFSKRLLFFENYPDQLNSKETNESKSSKAQEDLFCSFGNPSTCVTTSRYPSEDDQQKYKVADENISMLDSIHHALPLVRSWFQFLFSLKGTLRGITRDTWDMFFTFMESVGDDGSGYNDAEAWPSLFDDFIEWLKDKNLDQC